MAWPTSPLVAVADLETAVGGSLTSWCAATDVVVQTQAGLAIIQGHQQVQDELMRDLPSLFRDMNGYGLQDSWMGTGYSLTWLDNILTNLANPTVLKGWEAAVCLFWLANSLITKFAADQQYRIDVLADQRKFWGGVDGMGGQAKIKKTQLYEQLQVAAQVPGQQPDSNRIRTQDRIMRR